jgi:hypothetical protein
VILFSRKKGDWSAWEKRFLAKARRQGFKNLLLGRENIPVSSTVFDEDTPEGLATKKLMDLNNLAYSELILPMDIEQPGGKVAFGIVKGSKSASYMDRNGHITWTHLLAKYAPKTAPSVVKLEREFRASKLKKGKDPDKWITYLEELSDRLEGMGSTTKEDQFLVHILNNLSKEYELQVLLMEKRIGSTIDPLSVEDLRADINSQFERLHMSEDENNSTSEGNALNAFQFKGRCHNCGKYGHKGANRQNKTSNGSNGNHKGGAKTNGKSGGFKGICDHCKKYGHKVVDCYTKKKEQGREQANNAVGGKKQDKEVILLALEEKDLENYEDLKDYDDLEEGEVNYTIDALRKNNQENIMSDNDWDLGEP